MGGGCRIIPVGMTMNPRIRYICVLSFVLVVLAAGCGMGAGNVPETRYFVIDYTLADSRNSGPPLPVSVGVDKFRSDSVYRTDKIVFRKVPASNVSDTNIFTASTSGTGAWSTC